MKKVLWIGPVVSQTELIKSKAVSPAANVWQSGFISGLLENNIHVTLISHVPYPTWPRGPIWALKSLYRLNGLKQYSISYLNVAYVREIWIALMSLIQILKVIPDLKQYHIFTYNPYPRNRMAVQLLRFIFGCKWISIIADNRTFGRPDFYLFLSYDYFKRFKKPNKLFCDGGVINRDLRLSEDGLSAQAKTKSLVFAGGLNNWTGIIEFIDLFSAINPDDYILNIYGRGEDHLIRDKQKTWGERIVFHGFVDDFELDKACMNAFAFINPRPLDMFRCENDFPSKLLLYLSYKKPIISTKSRGLSPEYDNILQFYSDLKSLEFTFQQLNDSAYYEGVISKISQFIPENTWSVKINGIIDSVQGFGKQGN